MSQIEIKHTACPYDCPSTCGFCVKTDGRRILEIIPDKEDGVSKGLICGKMRHYEKDVHSDKRLMHPLRRVGKKGEGKFEQISWEEAIREITDRWKELLEKDGGSAIAYCNYSGVMSAVQRHSGDAFFAYMGANQLVKTLCSSAKGAAYNSVAGKTGCLDPRELKDSDYYLVWGSQVAATRLQTMPILTEARKQGKKVVLIEALANGMAQYCDQTVLVKPGTDGALALAMMHVLVKEQLCDEEFLKEYVLGYEPFFATLKDYTPKWAEEITGIPADVIEKIAIEYGKAKAPAIILGSGNSRYTNGGMTVRLIVILSLLTGAWKKPGGGFCGAGPSGTKYIKKELISRPDFEERHKRGTLNINQIGAAICQEEIKSFYVYGSNPANSVSDQKAVYKGLAREDLFTVVHEQYMTDTARFADIVLPATTSVEHSDLYTAYGYCTFGVAKKVIEPLGECKSDWDVFCLLAKGMGFEDPYFERTEDEMVDYVLQNSPVMEMLTEEQKEQMEQGKVLTLPFADHLNILTPEKKFRITDADQEHEIPCYVPTTVDPDYPLRLIIAPAVQTLNAIFIEREEQVEKRGTMKLYLHTEDAKDRGIADGDRIICYNDLAEVEYEAAVTDFVAKGCVGSVGVYRSGLSFNGYTANALHHARLSDIGEATTMNDNGVEVKKK